MEAITATRAVRPAPAARTTPSLAGAGNIFAKEVREWLRTRRFVTASGLTGLLLAIVPIGVFIHEGGLRHGQVTLGVDGYHAMMEAWLALTLTLGNYLTVALTMGILIKEEETGTAQWLFTKPVSRAGYGLAKYTANAMMAIVAAVLVPSAVFLALTQALIADGVRHWSGTFLALGFAGFHAAVVVAIIVALSTFIRSQVTVAGIVVGLGFLPFVAARAVTEKLIALAPVMMGEGASQAAAGVHINPWEPMVSGLVLLPLCVGLACYRLRRRQLQ
jgi:ABC-2 type transport system permease protein